MKSWVHAKVRMNRCPCYLDVARHISIPDICNIIYNYLIKENYHHLPFAIRKHTHFKCVFADGYANNPHGYALINFYHHVPNGVYLLLIRSHNESRMGRESFAPCYRQTLFDSSLGNRFKQPEHHFWQPEQRAAFKIEFMNVMTKIYEALGSEHINEHW